MLSFSTPEMAKGYKGFTHSLGSSFFHYTWEYPLLHDLIVQEYCRYLGQIDFGYGIACIN